MVLIVIQRKLRAIPKSLYSIRESTSILCATTGLGAASSGEPLSLHTCGFVYIESRGKRLKICWAFDHLPE